MLSGCGELLFKDLMDGVKDLKNIFKFIYTLDYIADDHEEMSNLLDLACKNIV